jgi:signal transduction histidine kinase
VAAPASHVLNRNKSQNSRQSENAEKNRLFTARNAILALITALSLVGLYELSQWNYLLYHSSTEVFTMVIAFATFAIAWNSRRMMDSNYLLFVGIAFLFVGGLDLFHMLSYRGMNVFLWVGADPNVATQMWVAMRYLFAFSMLVPLMLIKRKVSPAPVFAVYSLTAAVLVFSIFWWQIFPAAYVAGPGLTLFKVASEYAISAVLLVAIVLLIKKRNEFSGAVFRLLLAAMATAIATEMAFTLYTDVYGIANMVGHLLDVVSFYFIYRALVETGLTKPYELLFRNLKQSEASLASRAAQLAEASNKLEEEMTEREAISDALRESEERLQMKLDSVLSPDIEIEERELSNILDVPALQSVMNDLFAVTKMGFALIDLKGNVLVGTGWQDICTQFHRVNPQTYKNCVESDIELSSGLKRGEIRLYKCENNMWDVVTPLVIGEKHVANVFFGQFFFEDEKVDRDLFAHQAEAYGFDKEAYLAAFDRVPKQSRESVQNLMVFYAKWSDLISKLSYGNLKLTKLLNNQKELQEKLEEYAARMEELAEERARKLQEAERFATIGQTAGMVGHDIRNPLQAITSELYLAKLDVSSLPDGETKKNLQESVRSVEDNVLYINKIVADLQDFARPLSPKKEQLNVENVLRESLAMVTLPENMKAIISTQAGLPPLIADSTMLKRVLTNLIQNAAQAMPTGGKITLGATSLNGHIRITVEDTGEGISEEAKAKLFTPLFTTKSKGQGFGLAVVKRLVEAQSGEISFESQQGKGTKFSIELPA